MTKRTYIYDSDLDAMVEITSGSNHAPPPPGAGMQIIRDLEPYRTAGADVAHGNKRIMIGGRRQHREFLKRNGYYEVGNEYITPKGPSASELRAEQSARVDDIKRAARSHGLDWL